MNIIRTFKINENEVIKDVCEFLHYDEQKTFNTTTKEAIKEICVGRLCKAVGITGKYNYKSEFFEFFSCVMGEAICEKLSIKTHIACDEIRLVKYEHINLVSQTREFLDNETIEEAFLDAFDLMDKFKYLIPQLKKV